MNKEKLDFQITDVLSEKEKYQIMELWNQEYPVSLAYGDILAFERYIHELKNPVHILLKINNQIAGWATKFDRDRDRWFAIILSSSVHGHGNGSAMMKVIKTNESQLVGWVIDHDRAIKMNGKPYASPLQFYQKHGFEVILDERLENPVLSAVKIRWSDH